LKLRISSVAAIDRLRKLARLTVYRDLL